LLRTVVTLIGQIDPRDARFGLTTAVVIVLHVTFVSSPEENRDY
jgi:hypothetical protein